MKSTAHKRIMVPALLSAALLALTFAGCGGGDEDVPPPPDYAKELAGSPPELAAIHDQSNELLPGGLDAFDQRLDELKGFPAVVNVWASWCGPCRNEFPLIQQAAAQTGRQVAFLGVNSDDSEEFAKDFLTDYPVPFPSYIDPDKDIANDLGATHGFPATAFYNADGEKTTVKHGEFRDQAELDQYIQEYAINGQSG